MIREIDPYDCCVQITIRINGGINKSKEEFSMEFSDQDPPSLKVLLKDCCKRFGWKEKNRVAKLYNKSGIEILEDDVQFIKADDILYLAIDGKCSQLRSKLNTPFVCLCLQENLSTIVLFWMITV